MKVVPKSDDLVSIIKRLADRVTRLERAPRSSFTSITDGELTVGATGGNQVVLGTVADGGEVRFTGEPIFGDAQGKLGSGVDPTGSWAPVFLSADSPTSTQAGVLGVNVGGMFARGSVAGTQYAIIACTAFADSPPSGNVNLEADGSAGSISLAAATIWLTTLLKFQGADQTSDPTSGPAIYTKAGALFYKGGSGTVTQIAPA